MKPREREQCEVKLWENEQSRTPKENSTVNSCSVDLCHKTQKKTHRDVLFLLRSFLFQLSFFPFFFLPGFCFSGFLDIFISFDHTLSSPFYVRFLSCQPPVCVMICIRALSLVWFIKCLIVVVCVCVSVVWRVRSYKINERKLSLSFPCTISAITSFIFRHATVSRMLDVHNIRCKE